MEKTEFENELYSVKEIANIFCVHKETIRRWIRSNKIKSVKVGREHRVLASEIKRVLGV